MVSLTPRSCETGAVGTHLQLLLHSLQWCSNRGYRGCHGNSLLGSLQVYKESISVNNKIVT